MLTITTECSFVEQKLISIVLKRTLIKGDDIVIEGAQIEDHHLCHKESHVIMSKLCTQNH